MRFVLPLFLAMAVVGLAACDTAEIDPDPQPLTVETVENLPADPSTSAGGGQPTSSGRYTLFDIETGEIVLAFDEEDRSDSLSTNWDIGFQGTNLIANTTVGSQGGIQIVISAFDEVTEAPEAGYDAALPSGSGNSWYNYAGPPTHLITPISGRVIVVKTADGRYAKLRILSYYRGAPEEPNAFEDADRYYTFEYVFQPDGSRSFETTTE